MGIFITSLWSYFAPLLLSICLAYGIKKLLKVKLDIAYAIGYMMFGLIIYVLVLCGIAITTGYIIFWSAFLLATLIFGIKGKLSYNIEKEDIGITLAFILLYTVVFFFDLNRGFTHWDEMSHWGPMVKENLRLNQLYSIEESRLQAHKDYPPVIALVETAWSNLCGGYAEKYLYRSLHMLIMSMLFPMITYLFSLRKRISTRVCSVFAVVPFVTVCTVLSLDDGNMLTTIYADGVLAVTAAFCVFLIIILRKYKMHENFILAIALSFLLLVKQIGFEYYCLCYLLLILTGISDYKSGTDKKCILNKLFLLLVVPIAFCISWNIYIKVNHFNRQFTLSKFDINMFKSVVMKTNVNTWQYEGTVGFFDALFTKPLAMLGEHVISYMDLFILYMVVYLLLLFLQKRIKKNYYIFQMFITFVVSAVGHVFMMWVSYMFMYCESDFIQLACWKRYMNVIWIFNGIILIFLTFALFYELLNDKLFVALPGVAVICAGAIILSDTAVFLQPALQNNSSLKDYYEEADFICENTDEESSIFIVTQSHTGYFEYVFQYLTMPRSYNNTYYSLGKPYSEEDNWTRDISAADFLDMIEDYDYIYFWDIDEQFIEEYGMALNNAKDIIFEDGYLYHIESNGNENIELNLSSFFNK